MDEIARLGVVGRSNNVPAHLPPGSDVANLSLFGYDPNKYFTGRAPLEAAAQGIKLGPDDWAIRCNLVTIENQTMRSFTADHVSTAEATELLKTCQQELGTGYLEFIPGVSYRNLLLYRGAKHAAPFTRDTRATPPHDLTDKSVADDFPRGPGSDLLERPDGPLGRLCLPIIRSTPPAKRRASCPRRTSGCGAWAKRRRSRRSTSCTANAAR